MAAKIFAVPHRLYSSSTRAGYRPSLGAVCACARGAACSSRRGTPVDKPIVGPVIDVQHVLHRVHERGVLFRRNAGTALPSTAGVRFFRLRSTELLLTLSNTLSSTSFSASSPSHFHRACPAGARCRRSASPSPRIPSSRRTCAAATGSPGAYGPTSPPSPRSRYTRLRTRSTVTNPTSSSSAISRSVRPSSSLQRRIKAHCRFRPETRARHVGLLQAKPARPRSGSRRIASSLNDRNTFFLRPWKTKIPSLRSISGY